MKKFIMTLAAVLCCAMNTESVLAQTPGVDYSIGQYVKMTNMAKTIQEYTTDYSVASYDQDSMRVGIQSLICDCEAEIFELYWPDYHYDTLTAICSFSDIYGQENCRFNNSADIRNTINSFFQIHEYKVSDTYTKMFPLKRGGEYVFWTFYDFLDIDRHDTLTVYDEPSLRVDGRFVIKTGDDFMIQSDYNTGYPYDINSLTGEEYADLTIFKMENDSTGREAFKHRFPLHLKDVEHPLLAGIDSIMLRIEKPEIGPYLLRFETNWEAVPSRDIPLSVNDTLRANVTLDKQTYDLTTDKQAHLTLKMDYRYPHVQAVEPDSVPTIRVTATLLKDKVATDSLMTDTLYIVSDTLATKDLNYAGQWDLDLTKIDASQLTDGESTYQLKINITFNNEQQYETFIPVELRTATGISILPATRTDDEATYTLSGIRMNPRKPLSSGIYIRKGKKIISK